MKSIADQIEASKVEGDLSYQFAAMVNFQWNSRRPSNDLTW